jgi:hypothetical protein
MAGRLLYLLYGAAVLALAAGAEYGGWLRSRARESRTAPQSVRQNPGAYRPIYIGTGRGFRGK